MKFLKGLLISLLSLILFGAIFALGFAFMLNQTVMDPNFTANEIDKMDMAALASSFIQVPDSAPDSAALNSAIAASIKAAEPELKNELRTATYTTYDYFFGRNNNLNINISLEPVRSNLKTTLRASLLKSQPAMSDAEFNLYFDQFAQNIPPSLSFDSSSFDQSTVKMMQEIKQVIAYYQFWWVTIPLILLLALAIILLENNLSSSLRNIGFNLFLFGALGIAGDYLMKYLAGPNTLIPGLPAAAQIWFGQFLDDIFAPLNTFSIAVAVIGAVLIAGSFFVPKKENAGE